MVAAILGLLGITSPSAINAALATLWIVFALVFAWIVCAPRDG